MVRHSQEKPSGNLRKFLQERLDKVNPRRTKLTVEENKRLARLKGIADCIYRLPK